MSGRDDFSLKTKEILAKRVGTLCSNPKCSMPTYGPSSDPNKSTNKGVASHITAASPGGPRYDDSLSEEQRSSIDNGIWLCEGCAKMIDTDENAYTVSILNGWKEKAEKRAKKAIENPRIVNIGPDFADTIVLATRQTSTTPLDLSGKVKPGRKRRKIEVKPINVKRDLIGPKIPLIFEKDLLKPDQCLYVISCQNQGSGIDHYVKIGVTFARSAVIETVIDNPNQVQILRGGNPTSSFVTVMIRDLLPGEIQSFRIIANASIPITIELWTQNSEKSDEIYIFDVVIGDDEAID